MPPEEARVVKILLIWDNGLVESAVMRVTELSVLETFVGFNEAIANDLDLRLMGDGLEIRVENGFLVVVLAVAVGVNAGVEALGEKVLSLWRGAGQALQDNDVLLV